jgi:hypothetical protein
MLIASVQANLFNIEHFRRFLNFCKEGREVEDKASTVGIIDQADKRDRDYTLT